MRPWKAPSSASIRATSASVQSAIWRKLPTPSPLSSTASLGPTPFSSCRLSAPVVDDAGAGFATGGGGTVGSAGIAAALGAFLAAGLAAAFVAGFAAGFAAGSLVAAFFAAGFAAAFGLAAGLGAGGAVWVTGSTTGAGTGAEGGALATGWGAGGGAAGATGWGFGSIGLKRSEEHKYELQSLMRI